MQALPSRKSVVSSGMASLSGRKPLLLALTLGILAAALTWSYVQRAGRNAHQSALMPVVVAAVDIPVRTQVTAQMLTIKQVASDTRHPKAFTAVEQLDGKVTNLPISAGEQVLSTKFFARKEDSGLAFRVPPGKRAVSVNVNEVTTSGGLIVPGDFVDVIGIFSIATASDSNSGGASAQDSASIVLQNIEVLAIAQAVQGTPAEPSGPTAILSGNKTDTSKQDAVARPTARTATMAVTPDEAEKLILAEDRGKIRLALRAVDDHQITDAGPTRLSSIAK